MKTSLQIKGMNCGHCVRAVEQALRKVAGVQDVKVSIGQAEVATDGPADGEALRAAVQDAGFQVI